MTKSKREPFATYRPYSRGLMADGFVDGKQYAYLSVAEAKHQIQTINAAFNARVDEEVKVALAHQEMELFSEKKIYESIEKAVSRAVAERDARIAELEKALRLSVKELVAWSEKINPFGWHFCCDSNVDGPENHNAECGVYSAIQEAVAVLGKGER